MFFVIRVFDIESFNDIAILARIQGFMLPNPYAIISQNKPFVMDLACARTLSFTEHIDIELLHAPSNFLPLLLFLLAMDGLADTGHGRNGGKDKESNDVHLYPNAIILVEYEVRRTSVCGTHETSICHFEIVLSHIAGCAGIGSC